MPCYVRSTRTPPSRRNRSCTSPCNPGCSTKPFNLPPSACAKSKRTARDCTRSSRPWLKTSTRTRPSPPIIPSTWKRPSSEPRVPVVASAAVRGLVKQSVIHIKNQDALCCARLTGLPEGPCGIPELTRFQATLPGYQIKVVSIDAPHMIVFKGELASDKLILLIQEDGHYKGCNSFAGFLSKSYYCHECDRGYDCNGRFCTACFQRECPDFLAAKRTLPPGKYPTPTTPCSCATATSSGTRVSRIITKATRPFVKRPKHAQTAEKRTRSSTKRDAPPDNGTNAAGPRAPFATNAWTWPIITASSSPSTPTTTCPKPNEPPPRPWGRWLSLANPTTMARSTWNENPLCWSVPTTKPSRTPRGADGYLDRLRATRQSSRRTPFSCTAKIARPGS